MIWLENKRTWKRLDDMITEAINGTFTESNYNETELSRVESKWKEYLSTSKMSMEQTKKERQHIKMMISDISHQTRTPLANICLYTEILEELSNGEEEKKILQFIHSQAKQLEFLMESLVKMSRLESNILEVNPIKQSIEPLIIKGVEIIRKRAEQKNITIEIKGNIIKNAVYDLKWTLEAFYNVLDNAIKYSKESSKIHIFLENYEVYCAVLVKDEGIGIREEERAKIFQRFYRSTNVQQEDGVGIGLYLTREILRKEDGYIKVESTYGKGSCFGIYLPIKD